MKMPWNRDDLGRELRAVRPTPPPDLENALEHEIRAEHRRSRSRAPRLRFGLAAATTAVVLASFTAVGGMAAASSSVRHAFTNVAQAVHLSSPATHRSTASSPASDQYGRKKSCLQTAYGRRAAALRAANAKLRRDLAAAGKSYWLRAAGARKLAAAQRRAALHAAYRRYLAGRKAAASHHAAAVKKANARYKADAKKCPAA
jgi:hypothetical protein